MSLPKQIIILFSIFFLSSLSFSQTLSTDIHSAPTDSTTGNIALQQQLSLTDSIINFGKKFLKKPYNYRPNNQTRFDCSGFASYVYGNFGYQLKRSSAEQAQQFGKVDRHQLKTGDLVFFSGRSRSSRVGHVGIVVNACEDGKFDFIHSSNQSGIVISKSDEAYYAKRYITAGRVINDSSSMVVRSFPTTKTQQESLIAENTPTNNTVAQTKEIIHTQYHTVKKGDTLYSISRKYGMSVNELKKNNQLNSDKIMPEQQLKIADGKINNEINLVE